MLQRFATRVTVDPRLDVAAQPAVAPQARARMLYRGTPVLPWKPLIFRLEDDGNPMVYVSHDKLVWMIPPEQGPTPIDGTELEILGFNVTGTIAEEVIVARRLTVIPPWVWEIHIGDEDESS